MYVKPTRGQNSQPIEVPARPSKTDLVKATAPMPVEVRRAVHAALTPAAGYPAVIDAGERTPLPSATPDRLWSDLEATPRPAELREIEDQISDTSLQLDGLWKRNGAEFRTQVLQSVLSQHDLPPACHDELASAVAELGALKEQSVCAASPQEKSAIDKQRKELAGQAADRLKARGAAIPLLSTVEQSAGLSDRPGSLRTLVSSWLSRCEDLGLLDGFTQLVEAQTEAMRAQEDRQDEDSDLAKSDAERATRQRRRLVGELFGLAAAKGR